MTYPNERDCEHGCQRGHCEICELKQQLADKSVDLQMKSSIVVQLQQQLADTQKILAYNRLVCSKRIAELEMQLAEAREQVERMKCCGNCKLQSNRATYCLMLMQDGVTTCDNWEAK